MHAEENALKEQHGEARHEPSRRQMASTGGVVAHRVLRVTSLGSTGNHGRRFARHRNAACASCMMGCHTYSPVRLVQYRNSSEGVKQQMLIPGSTPSPVPGAENERIQVKER